MKTHRVSNYAVTARACARLTLSAAAMLALAVVLVTPVAAQTGPYQVKWDQPPDIAQRTNIFNGWNQRSLRNEPFAADDWVCTTTNPLTGLRWWGSFIGWIDDGMTPPPMPSAFYLTIWTDVPVGPGNTWSHPGIAIHQVVCTNFTWSCAGVDYDPRDGSVETCYVFEQPWVGIEQFWQMPLNGTNIYWLSIEAEYPMMVPPPYPWGWKTRPRDPASPAPDAAVIMYAPLAPLPGMVHVASSPLLWPTNEPWDLAFELLTVTNVDVAKWVQWPDTNLTGLDVHDTRRSVMGPGITNYLLADDFLCTNTGPITNVTVWGSWLADELPFDPNFGGFNPSNVIFTLSIHADIPATNSPTGYSMPGPLLWFGTFGGGQFVWREFATNIQEGWLNPPTNYIPPPADTVCHEYTFTLDPPFIQQGTPTNPIVYWLDVQARPLGFNEETATFGWKTSLTNWNDAAVYAEAFEPHPGPWEPLRYPPGHPYATNNIDLAFRLNNTTVEVQIPKWSQPPVSVVATNLFNGWDEPSRLNGMQIVADDWVCTNATPVTDIHWWGSFIGWTETNLPPDLPLGFQINIWSDIPAGVNTPYSHPGIVLHTVFCPFTLLTNRFVGWDIDPRTPDCPAVEATFKWDCYLATNEWFYQSPGTNIYWISIAAMYPPFPPVTNPWGWKTRPRDPNNPAPDDAVRIFDPTTPVDGMPYLAGEPIEYPMGQSWDMAFTLTTQEQEPPLDYGDAPDGLALPIYPTLLVNNGARHTLVPGIFLGSLVDGEADGQPTTPADGDDLNGGPDDEEGVTFLTLPLLTGQPGSISVVASTAGFLNGWFDWTQDGDWSDPGEQVFLNVALSPGPNVLNFTVPAGATTGSDCYARFRFATTPGLGFAGPASDGEVEDYRLTVQSQANLNESRDYGDAPITYPVVNPGGGRHVIIPFFNLGPNIDAEPNGFPTLPANGDDLAGVPDDEDGVVFTTPVVKGSNVCVDVFLTSAYGPGQLDAWVDFNRDGLWNHPVEQIFSGQILTVGWNPGLCFTVPSGAKVGSSYARFRLTSFGGQLPGGYAQNGEVEDYVLTLKQKKITPPAITNIVVTNITGAVTGQVVTIQWVSLTDSIYQLETAPDLAGPPVWTEQGPEIVGPANTVTITNASFDRRFFRIKVPETYP